MEVVERRAVHALHGDDPGAAVVPVDLGRRHPLVVAEGGDVVAELGLAEGLEGRVELLVGDGVQVFDDALSVGHVPLLGAHEELCDAIHDPQVAIHALGDVGPLHLEHGLAPVEQHAGMDLGDRRCRQRRVVEGPEDLVHGPAQVLAHDAAGGLDGERRDLVEEPEARVGQGAWEQPRGGGDELAELHECRTQQVEGLYQALGQLRGPRPAARDHHAGEGANEDEQEHDQTQNHERRTYRGATVEHALLVPRRPPHRSLLALSSHAASDIY